MAQVAADMLGLPLDNISIKLGDSTLPQCSGGGWIVDRSFGLQRDRHHGPAKYVRSCSIWRAALMTSPLAGATLDDVVLTDGKIVSKRDASRAISIADAMWHGHVDRITQEKTNSFPRRQGACAQHPLGDFRRSQGRPGNWRRPASPRVVSAVAAGRILNLKTAHSQVMGSVVWGIGMGAARGKPCSITGSAAS